MHNVREVAYTGRQTSFRKRQAMTTWTLHQVSQAERLVAKVALDDALLNQRPEVADYAADKMAAQLTHMAHPFGIELHRDDFEVRWTHDDATPWQVMGEMRWRPSTNAVELRGGHLDGVRYEVQKVGEPLRVPRAATTPWWSENDESATASVVEMADTYELVGWREDERVWVYEAK